MGKVDHSAGEVVGCSRRGPISGFVQGEFHDKKQTGRLRKISPGVGNQNAIQGLQNREEVTVGDLKGVLFLVNSGGLVTPLERGSCPDLVLPRDSSQGRSSLETSLWIMVSKGVDDCSRIGGGR